MPDWMWTAAIIAILVGAGISLAIVGSTAIARNHKDDLRDRWFRR